MVLLKLLIFTLIFYELIADLDALLCPKGHRINRNGNGCEVCPDGSYQAEENDSQMCSPCTNCETNRGSIVTQKCTKEVDTKCRCRAGFVSWEPDFSTCKCEIGFGLLNGECVECEAGYFNNRINSRCQKWTECKSGVNITGSKTKDVICNELKSNHEITTTFITRLTAHRPHEETQTQNIQTTTTTAPPGHRVITKQKETMEPIPSSNPSNYIGIALLIGIFGLLVLTAVTCKTHIISCVQRRKEVKMRDSCRRPVEESGDGSLSSLKQNLREP